MGKAFALLIDILKSEICELPLSLSPLSPDEAKELYLLSKRQELTHIVGNAVCREGVLADVKAKAAFEKASFSALYRYEQMTAELKALSSLFEEKKIPFLPLKGSVLREFYPTPWMRNSCDIDVLVREETLDAAKAALLEAGYLFREQGSHDAAFDSPRGVHIELHFTLIEEHVMKKAARILKDPWAHAAPVKEGSFRYALSDAAFYFYHVAHMAKHYLIGGCGIRPLLDLWVMNHRMTFDASAREALLKEGGLLSFHEAAMALSEAWFGCGEMTPLTERMEHFILTGGVYGSVENRVSVQQAEKGGKLRYALFRIFLPYDYLKFQYPILQKHKWLLPVCEVRRWCKLIFLGGARRSARELQLNSAIEGDTMQKTKDHLKELGF